MALFKSTEGIIINATNSVSANYGSKTWHLVKDIPTNFGTAAFLTLTQTSSPTTRIPVNVQIFATFHRKAEPFTEIPCFVQHTTIFLNTNGNPTFEGNVYNQSGGNTIGGVIQSTSGTTATISGLGGTTEEIAGMIITLSTDQWNRISISI
jgi:hypothetical protein